MWYIHEIYIYGHQASIISFDDSRPMIFFSAQFSCRCGGCRRSPRKHF